MGFDGLSSWEYRLLWPELQNKYQIKLADVHCPERYWATCSYNTTDSGSNECTHNNDVIVSCTGFIISCPPGMYRSYRTCKTCPSNTYKAVEGTLTSCFNCPDSASSSYGAVSCSCPAGLFWNGSYCLDCPEGSVSQEGALECETCPPGSTAITGAQSCHCSSGMTWNWDPPNSGSCLPCLPGTYKHHLTASCLSCPAGTTSTTGSQHCICEAGMFWNSTNCQDCSRGTVSQEGALTCLACPLGSVVDQGDTCKCHLGKKWRWRTSNEGYCEFISSRITTVLLVCVVLVLAIICFVLSWSLISERKKNRENVTRSVALARYGGLGVSSDQDSLITD